MNYAEEDQYPARYHSRPIREATISDHQRGSLVTISCQPAVLSDLHATALLKPGTPLRLSGMFNLRDLGGYLTSDGRRTRTGRIFRADSLAHLTDEDILEIEQ